jgi:peptidoglycan/xylan/chitin deacetylase (PgdA/CDA1 family)
MNPVVVAARGKGARGAARRAAVIVRHYGVTTGRMEGAIDRFLRLLDEYDAPASFPVTGAALSRTSAVLERHAPDVEFPIHGYYHVDHALLPAEAQLAQLQRAQRLWQRRGIPMAGFRAPYLRTTPDTLAAVRAAGLRYDASRAIAFPLDARMTTPAYRHATEFEMAVSATDVASLPRWEEGVLRLPYTLPDDEAIADRLDLAPAAAREVWVGLFRSAYERGELVVLGLHPERIVRCEPALRAVLAAARSSRPPVWIARLDAIADWWTARAAATIDVAPVGEGEFVVTSRGPAALRVIARGVEIDDDVEPWYGTDRLMHRRGQRVRAAAAPIAYVSAGSSVALDGFLKEHGYPFQRVSAPRAGTVFLDRPVFGPREEKDVLDALESSPEPLVRLGRWPHGARSALAISGDIDALSIWDYGLRVFGR